MYKLDHHKLSIPFDPLFSKTSYIHTCVHPRICARIPLNVVNQPNLYAFTRLFKQLIIDSLLFLQVIAYNSYTDISDFCFKGYKHFNSFMNQLNQLKTEVTTRKERPKGEFPLMDAQ